MGALFGADPVRLPTRPVEPGGRQSRRSPDRLPAGAVAGLTRPMRILSTVPDYLRLAAAADRGSAWSRSYEAAHPDVFAVYYREWGDPRHRAAAAEAVDATAPLVQEREQRARALLEQVTEDLVATGLLPDTDVSVVLMVGQHTSNGWVTPFRREPTLFLALEFLGDTPHDDMLIVHEAIHLAHQLAGPAWVRTPELTTAGELFFEGLAVAATQALRPGLSDSTYFWFDDEHPEWAAECAGAAAAIAPRLKADLDETLFAVRRRYFASPPADWDQPVRSGYWIGAEMCRGLLRNRPLHELIRWEYPTARRAAEDHLTPGTA